MENDILKIDLTTIKFLNDYVEDDINCFEEVLIELLNKNYYFNK